MKPELFWIRGPWPGRLAIMARPRGADWLADEAAGWSRAGLDVVVSLLESAEAAQLGLSEEATSAAANGVAFFHWAIPDRGVPPSLEMARTMLEAITDRLQRGHHVGVHCRQSVGRAGLVTIALLMLAGLPLDDARALIGEARGVAVPETPAQLEWLDQHRASLLEPAQSAR